MWTPVAEAHGDLVGGGRWRRHPHPGLPNANRTTDEQVIDVADREQRVVVTKDADFVDSHLLRGRPAKLLLISTGNISNRDLAALMIPLVPDIVREFQTHSFLELGRTGIVVRG